MLCDYGCGKPAQHVLKNGKHCCGTRPASCPTLKEVNSSANKKVYKLGQRLPASDRYAALPEETKRAMNWSKGKSITPTSDILCNNSTYSNTMVRNRIQNESLLEYKCLHCGITEWNGVEITLELDHINGNNRDNRLENLRFLCPNCHSLTETFRGRNINSGRIKVSDEQLLAAYETYKNIRQALISVGLAAKGANYTRLSKLLK